jgi:hypothetical protein
MKTNKNREKRETNRIEKKSVTAIHSDNGGEYIGKEFQDWMASRGILHKPTAPYTLEHNGVAERMNRFLLESASCMLLHAGLSGSFWVEAVNLANSIRNARPTKSVVGITPFQALHNEVPSMERYKVFGCKAMALIQGTNLHKFSSKTRDLIYLGPGHGSSSYKLWNLTSRCVIHSRSVTFLEDVFPYISPDLVLSLISDPFALAYDSDIIAIGHQQESLVDNSPIELGGPVLVPTQGPLPPPPSNRT